MKRTIYSKSYFTLVLFLISGNIQAKTPDWFLKGELKGYDKKNYFIGIGQGVSYQNALDNANVFIASQLKVSVNASIETSQSEFMKNDEVSTSESFNEDIKTSVDQSLGGVEVVKNETHDDMVYVFAVLDKQKYFNNLRFELDDMNSSVDSYVTQAQRKASIGEIYSSLENYSQAQGMIPDVMAKMTYFNSISKIPYVGYGNYSESKLNNEIEDLFSKINMDLVSGDDQSAIAGKLFDDPIIVELKVSGTNEAIANMPMTTKYADGDIAHRGKTDEDGVYAPKITAHDNDGDNDNNALTISLSPTGALKKYRRQLKGFVIDVAYEIEENESISFDLSIVGIDGNRSDLAEIIVSKAVEKSGNEINENSVYALIGELSQVNRKEIKGMSGIQYMTTVMLDLSLKKKDGKRSISSITARGKGLSKIGYQDSLERAVEKIKISQKKLNKMLAKAEN